MAFDSKNAIQIRPKSQDSLCMYWDNGNNDFPVSVGDCKDDDSYLWSFQADNGEDYGCFYNKAATGQRLSFRNTSTSSVTSYRAAVATIDDDAWQYWRPSKTTDGLYYINNEELDAHYLYWYQTTAILKISSTRPPPADAYIWKFTSVKETKSASPTTTNTKAPSATDTTTADDNDTDTDSGGLSKGAKIGLGIAIPLAAILILGLALWFWRKRKNGSKVQHSPIPQQSENEAFSSAAMPGKLPYSQVSAVDPDHYSSTFVGSIHPSRPSSQIENHEPQYDFRPTPLANVAGGHAHPPVMQELPFVDEGEQLSRGMPRN